MLATQSRRIKSHACYLFSTFRCAILCINTHACMHACTCITQFHIKTTHLMCIFAYKGNTGSNENCVASLLLHIFAVLIHRFKKNLEKKKGREKIKVLEYVSQRRPFSFSCRNEIRKKEWTQWKRPIFDVHNYCLLLKCFSSCITSKSLSFIPCCIFFIPIRIVFLYK